MWVKIVRAILGLIKSTRWKRITKAKKLPQKISICHSLKRVRQINRSKRNEKPIFNKLSRKKARFSIVDLMSHSSHTWRDSGLHSQSTTATCRHLTLLSASVKSPTGLSSCPTKKNGLSLWIKLWGWTNSCQPRFIFHLWISPCVTTQYCISWRRSPEFSRPKRDVLSSSVLRCTDPRKFRLKPCQMHYPYKES